MALHKASGTSHASWQTALGGGLDQESPLTVSALLDSFVRHRVSDHISSFDFDLSTPALLCAAWALVISRQISSDDVLFGFAVNGKLADGAASVVPLHLNTTATQTVAEYLARLRRLPLDAALKAPYHDDLDTRRGPAFQTMLCIRTSEDIAAASFPGQEQGQDAAWIDQLPRGCSLAIELHVGAEETTAAARFSSDVFPPWLVQTLLQRLGFVVLQLATVNPEHRLAQINMVTPQDLHTIWQRNGTVPPPVNRCVHHIISDIVSSQPDAPAVCAWDGTLTYGQLDGLASRLASELAALGVREGMVVPVCFEKSLWVTVAVLGVLKAGGAFLLIDSGLPVQRVGYMIRATGATLMLASQSTQELCSRLVPKTVLVNADLSAQPYKQPDVQLSQPSPSSLMYAVFTSGSTGLPKCVLMTHANVASALHYQAYLLGFTKDSRILDYSSYSFTTTISNFFGALAVGGCLCIPSDQDRQDRLAHVINALRVDTIDITPTVMQTLDPDELPTLKAVVFGGEAASARELERWWGKVRLIHLYGQSECTANATINDSPRTLRDVASIGHGAGLATWIVEPDNHDRLAPVGCVGELLLEGPLVGHGYLNDVEKTSAVFIEDPAWLLQGVECKPGQGRQQGRRGRMYKTGDLVRYNEDGSLTFHGRKDTQVKIRGQRVELGEVEHWVQKCTGAMQVAAEVIVPRGERSSPTLVAFLQAHDEAAAGDGPELIAAPVPSDVQHVLSQHLPAYMLPTAFFWIRSLPKTPSRKLDRKALRQISAAFSVEELAAMRTTKGPKQQPLSDEQLSIQKTWAAVLNIPTSGIGLDDSFFHLGGDSVAAIKVASELRKVGIQLSVAEILGHPVLRELACRSSRIQHQPPSMIAPFSLLGDETDSSALASEIHSRYAFGPATVQDVYPCTKLQEGLLSLTLKRPGNYLEQSVFEITPGAIVRDLCAAWEQVVRSMPVLRTRFAHTDTAVLVQVVLDEPVHWMDATGLEEYLADDRRRPMGLGSPLARYALVKDDAGAYRWLVWTVHHAICDGWTAGLIMKALGTALKGEQVVPGPPFPNFIDYIKKCDDQASTEYWQESLADCACPPFPSLPPSVDQPLTQGTTRTTMSQPRASRRSITASTLIRAAWGLTIGAMTSSAEAVFGVTVSGRNAPIAGIEAMAGPTFATVPVRVKLDDGETVSSYLQAVQQQAIGMIPFEQTGLQAIARMSPGCRKACMFQSLLVIQPQEMGGAAVQEAPGFWMDVPQQQWLNTYALTLEIRLGTEKMQVSASFDSRVVAPLEVQRILDRLRFVLEQLDAADDTEAVGQIQLLTPRELDQIWGWNHLVPPPAGQCVHHVIEQVVKAQPDAPAIDAWDGRLTYAELYQLSGRISRRLVELGVQPDTLIPLCFEKSMWTSVAMLAVLRARAGFVLLEPSLPQHRLEAISKQVGSPVILSSPANLPLISHLFETVVEISPGSAAEMEPANVDASTEPPQSPSTAMFAVFTSGSTGVPKGVVMSHDSFYTGLKYQSEPLGFTRHCRVFDFAAYSFDIAVHNVFATWTSGGCLCVPAEEDRWGNLGRALLDAEATLVNLTPSVARLIDPSTLPHLTTMILAGEAVTTEDAARWLARARVVNAYGPAECGISTINVSTSLTAPEEAASIGKGAGLVTWVVHPHDHSRLLPLGCIGELLLEGPLVGRGYLHDEQKTATSFIQDPPWLLRGTPKYPGRRGRLYKTGDLVRYDEDGKLTFLGRRDTQVKIRGQRVELAEVEHFIRRCVPEVGQVAAEVILPRGEDSGPTLAAFLTMNSTESAEVPTKTETSSGPHVLRIGSGAEADLAKQLPRHMRPSIYISMREGLPLTATGKVDRKRLREIGATLSMQHLVQNQSEGVGQRPKRQPESETERQMQKIWSRVLKLEATSIGMDDNFFELGGDSIAVMIVVAEARKFGLHLTARELFRHPSLSISLTARCM